MGYCSEFQAVVLAGGKGSRMTELTAGKPKCLLPIGNMPMIWYPLKLLEQCGFKEAIVIVPEAMKNDISTTLDPFDLKVQLEIVEIQGNEDLGTADSLRLIHEKIHMDFLVISCDLIMNIDIGEILNTYRKHNASITALMLKVPKLPDNLVTPGPKNKQKPETDLIGIDNETGRLVLLASASDFEENITFSRKLIQKHSSFTVHSKLMDAHLYVMKKWVLDFLVHNKTFSTLKGELLSHIVSKQLKTPPKQCLDDKNASLIHMDLKEDIFRFAVEDELDNLIRKMSAFNDHSTDLEEAYYGDRIRCYAYNVNDQFGLRANTIQMYNLANLKITELWNDVTKSETNQANNDFPSANVKSTQIENSRIGENSLIDEKTSIKNSHIGSNTKIEPKTRISQSIIMENVTIKQRCVIENSILCNGCIIEEGTELKHCLVGAQHQVPSGSSYLHEVLTNLDRLIEI